MSGGEGRTPSAEEVSAYERFARADKQLKAGQIKPAIGLFREGVEKLEAVAVGEATALVRFDLAETIASIGDVLAGQGQGKESHQFYAASIRVVQGLELPALPPAARMVIGTWHVRLSFLTEAAPAEESARAALAILEPLVDDPQTPAARAHLANVLLPLARSLILQRRTEEARAALARMPPLLDGLPDEFRAGLEADRQDMLEVAAMMDKPSTGR